MKHHKHTLLPCAALLCALLLGGCGQQQGQMSYIGAESAKQAALSAAGLTAQEASFSSVDMLTRDGLDYYQLTFTSAEGSYQYDVDALTGVVISAQTPDAADLQTPAADPRPSDPPTQPVTVNTLESLSGGAGEGSLVTDADTFGSTPGGAPAPASPAPGAEGGGLMTDANTSATDANTSATPASPPANAGANASGDYIGEERAKTAALDHAGLSADQVRFVHCYLERDDGRWLYDVEFYADNKEYDYDIDAYTGAVLSFDYDAEYYTPPAGGAGTGTITAEQARQLALAQVPGATDGDIRKFKTDYDDGILQYEGKIIYNGMEYEFEIDAYSGAFREWSAESVHH